MPGHFLGHRVLHLQARIDFEKVEIPVRRQQKLDRSGIRVAGGLRGAHRHLAHLAAQRRAHRRRG